MRKSIISEKAFKFSLSIIDLYQKLQDKREFILSNQLLKSSTSIGANIRESSAAQSKRDFFAKLSIASKEARETQYWLELLQESNFKGINYKSYLEQIDEIIRILNSILITLSKSNPK